ncbi:efflux RND transporter periplasmic adaptor subunit [Terriglobus albidus]|uniref:Efflux RND transporter periplasmic adaptor subunit n=1 Tax=Terriglobus albidus TaxID=1592106 RepID=A0A5B9E3E5_9BACT|nr:efflux RND transporter periplasmic adaptor subunit [Terriglobus albidus]QEE26782.1 efflux RND transporter periplasmic adaptor subunit [Terriglobus albidus]
MSETTQQTVTTQTTTNRKPMYIAVGVAAVALVAAVAWGIHDRVHAESELKEETRISAIQTVHVVHATGAGGKDGQELILPGNAQAYTDTPIYARTGGYLRKWYADIGQHVKQGQLLAQIETPELDQQLQAAEADLKQAQANLDLAKTTNDRWQALVSKRAVSKQEADQAQSTLEARQSLMAASEANVRRLQQLQGFERVIAPFDGTITARNTDVGALITAAGGGSGATGSAQELFHLAAVGKLRVYVAVPEVYSSEIQDGMKVELTQDATPDLKFTGTVVRNSNAIDQSSRTLNVEVDVDNPQGKLMPGAYVFAHFRLAGKATAVTLPSNALLFRSEGLRVGIVRDNHVQLVPIRIGRDFGSNVEVISGLNGDDAVILDPSDSLENGMEVKIAQAKGAQK